MHIGIHICKPGFTPKNPPDFGFKKCPKTRILSLEKLAAERIHYTQPIYLLTHVDIT